MAPKIFHVENLPDGWICIVMEFIDGKNLFEATTSDVQMKAQIEKAVSLLHEKNLVMGDLRSPNILLSSSGQVLFLVPAFVVLAYFSYSCFLALSDLSYRF
jgi:tRNA A-37 threonylcarbamoyl transferase component Bud32